MRTRVPGLVPVFALLTSALTACGPTPSGAVTHPGLVAAREGASSGGMSRVVASDIPPPSVGYYPTAVTAAPPEGSAPAGASRTSLPRPPMPIALGASVHGALQAGDPTYVDSQSRVDDYAFVGSAGQWVTIDLVGGDLEGQPGAHMDMYLHVLLNGSEVASDDDSGGNLNSRVTLQLPSSGAYVVRATTYGGDARLGAYTLSVRPGQQSAPPDAPAGTEPPPPPEPAPAPPPAP